MSTVNFIKINPDDNVAVAIHPLKKGENITVNNKNIITIQEDIPAGNKIALKDFNVDENIIKYGYPIGHTITPISQGSWINEKNIRTNLKGILNYEYTPALTHIDIQNKSLTFKGYRRKNGEAGIRNEIWIIPTVGCVNGIVNQLAQSLRQEAKDSHIDSIVAYTHNYGCSQLGDDHENTRKILRDMVLHPNAGGVLLVGLGCENNQLNSFKEFLCEYDTERVRFMECQKVDDEFEEGMKLLRELYKIASKDRRIEMPINKLRIGLKCGGSDGFSGITANPLLGVFSDFLISQGGTAVLTEVPEMFGAETILMNRCENREIFNKTVQLINNFKKYFIDNHQPVYENPSPGNKAGGISTLEEKSLGCTQKSGSAPVMDVLSYAEQVKTKGLNLLSAPGNDLVASTALAASGTHIVLFTTGRGTPFACPVPTMKISTNSSLNNRKQNWIDFNCGTLVEGDTLPELAEKLFDEVIAVASGKEVKSEIAGFHDMAIFKQGVTL